MALYVNGVEIDGKEIEAEIERLRPEYERVFVDQPADEKKKQLADWSRENVIERELIKQAAAKDTVVLADGAVDNAYEALLEQAGGKAEFYKNAGLGEDQEGQVKADIESRMKLEQLMERVASDVREPSQKEIEKHYHDNLEKYTIPEMIRAAHIVKHPNEEGDIELIKQEMQEVLSEIREKNNFEELAVKLSDCPDNAGDLGYFPRGQMVQAFEDVVFEMQPGDVSEVFQSEFGFHIAKVSERKPSVACPIGDVTEVIKKELRQSAGQKAVEKFIDSERAKAKIEDK